MLLSPPADLSSPPFFLYSLRANLEPRHIPPDGAVNMHYSGRISRASEWSTLRKVGNTSPAKLAILVPFVGWLVLFNEKLQPYIELSHAVFGAPTPGQAPVRLIVLYLSLCLISVASIIYSLLCPSEVKRYETAEHYTRD